MSQLVASCSNNHHQQQASINAFGIVTLASTTAVVSSSTSSSSSSSSSSSPPSSSLLLSSSCSGSNNYSAIHDNLSLELPNGARTSSSSIAYVNITSGSIFDRSRQTPVIVAPVITSSSSSLSLSLSSSSSSSSSTSSSTTVHIALQQQHQGPSSTEISAPNASSSYGASSLANGTPYVTAQTYLSGESSSGTSPVLHPSSTTSSSACSSSSFIYPSNFFQPYYGLSSTLSEFNVLQMCCQPLLTEIVSQGADISPTAESLYGFANRLHPITPAGGHHHQLNMPQAYQTRTGYVGNAMTHSGSAAGKRGGRRPKEYEEYDQVTLSEEERDKRDKRRLRNKEAAARCRQRRLDLMGSLQNQVDQLKEENKMKDTKIAELQLLKNELIAVIRDHHCVLPESLRQTLDIDMSSTQQYMPRGAPAPVAPGSTEIGSYPASAPSPQTILNRKRPASEMIPDLRQPPQRGTTPLTSAGTLNSVNQSGILTMAKASSMQIKQEPTLFDVNGRDLPDEEIKRPTSLSFSESVATTTAYSSLSSSGVPITTPSNLIGGGANDFGAVNLLDGPTGLTPCHPPQATAFQLSNMATPLGEGRSFETL